MTCDWLAWFIHQKFGLLVLLDRIRRDLAEEAAKKAGLSGEELRAHRQQKIGPIARDFARWLSAVEPTLLPSDPLSAAVGYYQRHWDALMQFIDEPLAPIDNSATEREFQNVAKLRLMMLFAGSTEGAHRASVSLGIVSTCRAIGVAVQAYLTWAFERLGTEREKHGLRAEEMTPAAYKASGGGRPRPTRQPANHVYPASLTGHVASVTTPPPALAGEERASRFTEGPTASPSPKAVPQPWTFREALDGASCRPAAIEAGWPTPPEGGDVSWMNVDSFTVETRPLAEPSSTNAIEPVSRERPSVIVQPSVGGNIVERPDHATLWVTFSVRGGIVVDPCLLRARRGLAYPSVKAELRQSKEEPTWGA